LVEIARNASTAVANVRFIEMSYDDLPRLDERFHLITSACGLDTRVVDLERGDDLPEEECLPDRFIVSPSLVDQFETYFGSLLANLRGLATPGGNLAMVERLTTFALFTAFAVT